MYCNNCGAQVPENIKFCPKCGYDLETFNNSVKPVPVQPAKGKSNKNILIVCIAVAVAVCVFFFLYGQGVFDGFGNKSNPVSSDRVVADDEEDEDEDEEEIKKEIDHSEAYDAYLDVLLEQWQDIDTYDRGDYTYDWKVSFLDVEEMDHPLMVIEALDDGEYYADSDYYYYSNNLRIYSYDDGLTKEVDKRVWHNAKATGGCSVFTTEDGDLYYVLWDGNEGGCHLNIEGYSIDSKGLTEEDTWQIEAYVLPFSDADFPDTAIIDLEYWREIENWSDWAGEYDSSYLDPTDYIKNGTMISQGEFFTDIDKILARIDTMSISYIPEILIRPADEDEEKIFSLKSYETNAMDIYEAIVFLGGDVEESDIGEIATPVAYPVFPYVNASSTRASMGSNSYDPELAFDGSWSTAWCEGQAGNGVGAWIEMYADTPQTVTGLMMLNGYCKSEKTYYDNNTIAEVFIETDEGAMYWSLYDYHDEYQAFDFSAPIKTNWIRITIEQVYEKGDGLDSLISELVVY